MKNISVLPFDNFLAGDYSTMRQNCRHLGEGNVIASKNAQASGGEYQLVAFNDAIEPASIKTVRLFNVLLPAECPFYMEGYQMLSQTAGTVGSPQPVGRINEINDYHLYRAKDGVTTGSNFCMIKKDGLWYLIGASSAFHTDVQFELNDCVLSAFWDLEGTRLEEESSYASDYLCFIKGAERSEVLKLYAELISKHHEPHLSPRRTGWCSWYCYYADITEALVRENLDCMVKDFPECEYVQIDDGYQTCMGDWLCESPKFESGLKKLCADIRARGKKPAIWLAPFIADGESEVFKNHPEWFIHDENGKPLAAENVTYGGWRCTPWYLLDMTVNAVRSRIKHICAVMRNEYGIDYFKLDACYWGAIRGLHYKHEVSAVTHYRLGLSAVRQGAGDDAFILGCNAPLWPSLGLVDAQRLTDDVERSVHRVRQISREFRMRAWMSGRLWAADTDCLVTVPLPGGEEIPAGMFRILLGLCLCSAGSVLLGDDLRRVDTSLALVDSNGSGAALTLKDALLGNMAGPADFRGDNADVAYLQMKDGSSWELTFTDDDVQAKRL